MAAITSIIGLAVSAVGAGLQFQQQKKAQKQQQRQFEESQKLQKEAQDREAKIRDLQTQRERRKLAREAQQRRAGIVAGAEAAGISGSSGAAGATGAVATQAATGQAFLSETNELQDQAATLFGQAREVGSRPIKTSGIGQAVSAIGGTIFSAGQSNLFG